ncbi:hypothetical protein HMPREF9104_00830 [Lentilactobacillus kisonensis F0435]|uniref:Uncharacterized protein n=1 Tax=Lentilactobacillus kisonensis F0435 TaxID=797516 RepID=H1LE04_9LACO|nr:hypothetical protein HMPREF9104_00830 [Lentilactobacillus kisonensis F0435]
MPIFAGDKKPVKNVKITKRQYVKILIMVNLDLVAIVCQLSNWNLDDRSATIIPITIQKIDSEMKF